MAIGQSRAVDQQAGTSPGEPLTVRTLEPSADSMSLWRMLEARIGNGSIAASADWNEEWLQHYGDIAPGRLVVGEAGGMTRGLCLLTLGVPRKAGPLRIRTLHLGTAGEPDEESVCVEYNRMLVEPGYELPFAQAVVQVARETGGWDVFHAEGFTGVDLRPWQAALPAMQVQPRDSRFFDLTVARRSGDIIEHLGRSTRAHLRRTLRKYGGCETEWAETSLQADDILAEMVVLHQARWQTAGQPGAFAGRRFLHFQQGLVARLLPQQRVVLFRVRHEGATIGCLMLLVDHRRLLAYISGFASFDERPSPGLVTHFLCMQEALRRGYDAYDFLVGDKRLKDNLSNDCAQLMWGAWERPGWKNKTLNLLRKLKRRLQGLHDSQAAEMSLE